ncbi:MAG: 2-amino-4-hydroxy-6-hydroxymethyldihydropteridine diphosphokinase [Thermoguttaceae bacterium]|nr:2-amino-4-hydroxy-6-hydroxymethyldihydropteridine diphosphokinase [Thermoguttaceae bacterium]MDW8078532.1 2-amino-4-hydroxy-6-hydroxymethyldihydropteridine diphosphokinase [Thermoguttaceae bacterium]
MALCLVGLGSNLGDRRENLSRAISLLDNGVDTRVLATSRLYESKAAGGPASQPNYLNVVILLDTALDPLALLDRSQDLERSAGRVREVRWGPRTLDIDLLIYEDVVCEQPSLLLPHPRMGFRRFVLEPAAEIAPTFRHPVFGLTIFQLLNHLDESAPYLALTGLPGCGKSALVKKIARPKKLVPLFGPPGVFSDRRLSRPVVPLRPLTKRQALRRLLRRESRLLFRRSELLAKALARWKWTEVRSVRLLTDFWPWESAALFRVLRRWGRRWPAKSWQLVRTTAEQFTEMLNDYFAVPKLVIHLDSSSPPLVGSTKKGPLNAGDLGVGPRPEVRLKHLALALRREVARPFRGPWLRLVDVSRDEAAQEILAAVEAMEIRPTPLRHG